MVSVDWESGPKGRWAWLAATLGVVAAGTIALTGCETAEQIRQSDEQQCASYGFQPGTVPFAQCLQQQDLARQYRLEQPWGPWWGYGYRIWR